ncbi:MAG: hypothetical protein FWB72_07615, partial [Firmicutes bacterium]|nr:hypothetical protein [Bacillota bacterium]
MRKDKGKNKTIRADKANSDTGVATSVDMGVNISDTEVDMVIATEVASANTKLDTNASIAAMNESVKIANTNETLRIETKRARRLFATVADVSSVLMALVYISYVTMLLIFEVGQVWLNWAMLGVAFAYIIFFGIKIFVLNRNNPSLRMRRITNRIYKYTKYGMRIINAAFIIFSIIVVGEDQSLIALVGVVILIVTFIIAVFWDILTMVVRRRLKDL